MATVKVFSSKGIRILECFDTLDNVPYLVEEDTIEDEPIDRDPFEDD